MEMSGTTKINVELTSLVFFYEPDVEWIVQEVLFIRSEHWRNDGKTISFASRFTEEDNGRIDAS